MKGEPKVIKAKFGQLMRSPMVRFSKAGQRLNVPDLHGMYIIYSPNGRVAHVRRTVRGKMGLRQRLNNHLHGASSLVAKALAGKGATVRKGYKFRYVSIESGRLRALLEAYSIGQLCPDHLGDGGG
jgi:hypothetical protein